MYVRYNRCLHFYTVLYGVYCVLCDLYPGLGEGVVVLYPVQDPGHAPEGVRLNVGAHLFRQTVNLNKRQTHIFAFPINFSFFGHYLWFWRSEQGRKRGSRTSDLRWLEKSLQLGG
jgi:hypothetical protein